MRTHSGRKAPASIVAQYSESTVRAVVELLWQPSQNARELLAKKLRIPSSLLEGWEQDLLSPTTPLSQFPPSQQEAVAHVRLAKHLEGALNVAIEGAQVGNLEGRQQRRVAAITLQAIIGTLPNTKPARCVRAKLETVAAACVDDLGEQLVVPGDHRAVSNRNLWSTYAIALLGIVHDALDEYPDAARFTGGVLRQARLKQVIEAPQKTLDDILKQDPKVLDIARDISAQVQVDLLSKITAANALLPLSHNASVAFDAIVADCLVHGTASALQLGRALVFLLGVRDLKGFFDSRAVKAWLRSRNATSGKRPSWRHGRKL